jgi:signal transduction histidine kinase
VRGPRSLHLRLLVIFALILVPAGGLLLATSVQSARTYYQEITQRQNADLARNLLHDGDSLSGVTAAELADLVKMMEMANPGVEIYLLDVAGGIVEGPPGATLTQDRVALAPIDRFLGVSEGSGMRFPVLGTDPRRGGTVIFSVAPFADGSGFLYVVLTDEPSTNVLRTVQTSTTLRLVLWGGGIGIVAVLLAGAAAFTFLTRRLRGLTAAVRAFDPRRPVDFAFAQREDGPRDEIDELEAGFAALSSRVREQLEALEASDQNRRELITNVSHDLRTPLTALRGTLEAMGEDGGRRGGDELVATARRSAERLGRLIDGLFELSYLDDPTTPIEHEAFPLEELADDVVQKFALQAAAAGIDLSAEAPPQGRVVISGDIGQVERALSNLLDNALRFTPRGGRVTLRTRRDGTSAVIEVEDTGIGIAAADQARIFDRFYRVERARGGEGTGLGLAIVQRIVTLHGGEIGVRSAPGAGSTVTLTVPAAVPARAPSVA